MKQPRRSSVICPPASLRTYEEYARRALLTFFDAAALLQGAEPKHGWVREAEAMPSLTYIVGGELLAQRLWLDAEGGAIRFPCTPRDLLLWADNAGIRLHAGLDAALREACSAPSAGAEGAGRALAASNTASPESPEYASSGQDRGFDAALQGELDALAREWMKAHYGKLPKKRELVKELHKKHPEITAERIERLTRVTWKPGR